MTTATKTGTTITVDAADFKQALALVNGSTKDPLSGTHQVLITVDVGEMFLTGSTFNSLAVTSVAADVLGDVPKLPLSVDYERLSALVGAAQGTIEVSVLQNAINIASGPTVARLSGIPDPYPREWKETKPLFACEIDDLRMAVGRVSHFVAPEKDSRHNLTGIVLDTESDGGVSLSASNGYGAARTHLRVAQLPLVGWSQQQVIIPAGSLQNALRAFALVDGVVHIETAEGQITLRTPELSWSLRRIDGSFPDLRNLRPKDDEVDTWITVERDRLMRSLKLAGLFASKADNTKQDVVILSAGKGSGLDQLAIESKGSEHGAFDDKLDATVDGEDIVFKCAGPMLRDAAEATGWERIKIGLMAPDKPFLVVGDGAPDTSFQILTPCV